MKTITMSAANYTEIVYPSVSGDSSDNVKELCCAMAVLDKLEAQGVEFTETVRHPETGREMTATSYKPKKGDSIKIDLEDAEVTYLHDRLVATLPRLQVTRSRHLLPLLEALAPA